VASTHFKVLLQWDPDDEMWVTFVPQLNNLSTYGESREQALEETREAILGYFEAAAKAGLQVGPAAPEPELVDLEVAG